MKIKKGILVHPDELSVKWIDRAAYYGIDTVGIHPVGGYRAAETLRELTETLKTAGFRKLVDYALSKGVSVEYEAHAAGYLLDKSLFKEHPEYFRTDENGARNPDYNLCFSSKEALSVIAENAASLALSLYGSSHTFSFWTDDKQKKCFCDKCSSMTYSDCQLTVMNAMIREIRKYIPDARLSYLAYYECMIPPVTVKPENGIFLEYAPIEKYTVKSAEEEKHIVPLLDFFGRRNSRVLEYWLDNSMLSGWKKPPAKFTGDPEKIKNDILKYKEYGFEEMSTFACYLGEDYEALYGEPDIAPFAKAFDI